MILSVFYRISILKRYKICLNYGIIMDIDYHNLSCSDYIIMLSDMRYPNEHRLPFHTKIKNFFRFINKEDLYYVGKSMGL